MRIVILVIALLLTPLGLRAQDVEFNRDIRPLLSDKCFTCHGPDKARRLTKLRFDVEADAKQDLGGRVCYRPRRCVEERNDPADHRRRSGQAHAARRLGTDADGR